jgi:hypothetical protein
MNLKAQAVDNLAQFLGILGEASGDHRFVDAANALRQPARPAPGPGRPRRDVAGDAAAVRRAVALFATAPTREFGECLRAVAAELVAPAEVWPMVARLRAQLVRDRRVAGLSETTRTSTLRAELAAGVEIAGQP